MANRNIDHSDIVWKPEYANQQAYHDAIEMGTYELKSKRAEKRPIRKPKFFDPDFELPKSSSSSSSSSSSASSSSSKMLSRLSRDMDDLDRLFHDMKKTIEEDPLAPPQKGADADEDDEKDDDDDDDDDKEKVPVRVPRKMLKIHQRLIDEDLEYDKPPVKKRTKSKLREFLENDGISDAESVKSKESDKKDEDDDQMRKKSKGHHHHHHHHHQQQQNLAGKRKEETKPRKKYKPREKKTKKTASSSASFDDWLKPLKRRGGGYDKRNIEKQKRHTRRR